MLDRAELCRRFEAGEKFEFLFFWGHQVPEDGSITASCLSQLYPAPFKVDGIKYPTAEHWMMASKARLFDDDDVLKQILETADVRRQISVRFSDN